MHCRPHRALFVSAIELLLLLLFLNPRYQGCRGVWNYYYGVYYYYYFYPFTLGIYSRGGLKID